MQPFAEILLDHGHVMFNIGILRDLAWEGYAYRQATVKLLAHRNHVMLPLISWCCASCSSLKVQISPAGGDPCQLYVSVRLCLDSTEVGECMQLLALSGGSLWQLRRDFLPLLQGLVADCESHP